MIHRGGGGGYNRTKKVFLIKNKLHSSVYQNTFLNLLAFLSFKTSSLKMSNSFHYRLVGLMTGYI